MTEPATTPATTPKSATPADTAATSPTPHTGGELSSGAQAGIGVGIGVGNVCCGPVCYCVPSFLSTLVGIILYVVWREEKPKTAKNILMVTLITAGVAIVLMGIAFMFGMAGAIIDEMNW